MSRSETRGKLAPPGLGLGKTTERVGSGRSLAIDTSLPPVARPRKAAETAEGVPSSGSAGLGGGGSTIGSTPSKVYPSAFTKASSSPLGWTGSPFSATGTTPVFPTTGTSPAHMNLLMGGGLNLSPLAQTPIIATPQGGGYGFASAASGTSGMFGAPTDSFPVLAPLPGDGSGGAAFSAAHDPLAQQLSEDPSLANARLQELQNQLYHMHLQREAIQRKFQLQQQQMAHMLEVERQRAQMYAKAAALYSSPGVPPTPVTTTAAAAARSHGGGARVGAAGLGVGGGGSGGPGQLGHPPHGVISAPPSSGIIGGRHGRSGGFGVSMGGLGKASPPTLSSSNPGLSSMVPPTESISTSAVGYLSSTVSPHAGVPPTSASMSGSTVIDPRYLDSTAGTLANSTTLTIDDEERDTGKSIAGSSESSTYGAGAGATISSPTRDMAMSSMVDGRKLLESLVLKADNFVDEMEVMFIQVCHRLKQRYTANRVETRTIMTDDGQMIPAEPPKRIFIPKCIVWLGGPRGSGKTAVSTTVLDHCSLPKSAYIDARQLAVDLYYSGKGSLTASKYYDELLFHVLNGYRHRYGIVVDGFLENPQHARVVEFLGRKLKDLFSLIRFVILAMKVDEKQSVERQVNAHLTRLSPLVKVKPFPVSAEVAKDLYVTSQTRCHEIVSILKKAFSFQEINANCDLERLKENTVIQIERQMNTKAPVSFSTPTMSYFHSSGAMPSSAAMMAAHPYGYGYSSIPGMPVAHNSAAAMQSMQSMMYQAYGSHHY